MKPSPIHHISFNQIDVAAKEMAETIGNLAKERDPNNLVIMCGEYHETLAHHFYGMQLVKYLKRSKLITDYCAEFSTYDQVRLDVRNKKDKMTLGNLFTTASQLAYILRYSDRAMLPVAYARARNLPVHFIDMPFRIAKDGEGRVFPFDNKSGMKFEQHQVIKKMVARNVPFEQGFSQTSAHGKTCRDLYMAEQINALQEDSARGTLYTQIGAAHLVDGRRKTLANYLLETGKDIIMVGMQGSKSRVDYTHMLQHVTNSGQGSLLGFFKLSLPANTAAQKRASLEENWGDLLRANNISCPSLR